MQEAKLNSSQTPVVELFVSRKGVISSIKCKLLQINSDNGSILIDKKLHEDDALSVRFVGQENTLKPILKNQTEKNGVISVKVPIRVIKVVDMEKQPENWRIDFEFDGSIHVTR